MRLLFSFLIIIFIASAACRKSEEINTDEKLKLSFSTDTILFDTVFTSVGSVSKRIKIYNTDQRVLNISSIALNGGTSSPFSMIIDGKPANQNTNIQINGKDSASIFIKVTINPSNQALPFIVQDSILFITNGNRQSIPVIAYGQNAVFIKDQTIASNTTWTNILPYVIYSSVIIAPKTVLNIQPGTRILFHGNSSMLVKGTLQAEGTKLNPVLFAGDRLEKIYEEEPGQWNSIHFYSSSTRSKINYATIKNGIIGLIADSLSADGEQKLLLTNTIIRNMQVAGFIGYNSTLNAFNNLFFNCGQYLFYGNGGGTYNLKQNTFAGYNFNFPRKTAAVYFSDQGYEKLGGNLKISLTNNIIWGTLAEELSIDKKTNGNVETNIENNLIKTAVKTYINTSNLLNIDPGFVNPATGNFNLQQNSAVLNKGIDLGHDPYFHEFLSKDLNNKFRSFPSDLGCFESN